MSAFKSRSVLTVLCASVALTTVAACSSSTGGSSSAAAGGGGTAIRGPLPATIPVTLVADLTGLESFYGAQLQAGVKTGVAEVNSSGVLGGSKIVLTIKDTGSSAGTAQTVVATAVKTNAAAVLSPSLSDEDLATAPVAQAAGMPYLVEASPPGILDAGDYIYDVTTPQSSQTGTLVAAIAATNKKVAVIYADDNPTESVLGKQTATALQAKGVAVTGPIGTSIAATDFSAISTKAIQASPDAVAVIGGGPMMPSITKSLRNGGFKGQIFGNEGSDGTVQAAGSIADGYQYVTEWAPGVAGKASQDFLTRFDQMNADLTAYYPAVDGYTEMLFLAQALAKAGSVDHKALLTGLQAVATTGFTGPAGAVKFGGTGNRQLIGPAVLVQMKSGKASAAPSAAAS